MSDVVDEVALDQQLSAASVALGRGAWQQAASLYAAAAGAHQSPQALEGLGAAQWWSGDIAASAVSRQQAYCLYRQGGDEAGAARMALYLGASCWSLLDAVEAARGWLGRAERLLEGLDIAPEHGWVALWQAQLALVGGDETTASDHARRALEVGQLLGSAALESLAAAHQGLGLVLGGSVAGASALSEREGAAIAAERPSLELVGAMCSQLMYAWEQVKDFDSIERWWAVLDSVGSPWSSSWLWWLCRTHRAGALMWRGQWEQAEAHLHAAIEATQSTRADIAAEAMVRLARLRRRQGRSGEAASLLERAQCAPLRLSCEAQGLLASAELHLDRGESATARAVVGHLAGPPRHGHCVNNLGALALVVAAEVSGGKCDVAHHALAELQRSACSVASDGVRAMVRYAEGMVAVCVEEFATAVARLEEAVTLFERAGAGFETAQARLELAVALAGAGRQQSAMAQAATAMERLATLGACREAERGQQRLPERSGSDNDQPNGPSPARLTSRELEILRLVAAGRDNLAIADELTLSVRTVERHLSNIYDKLQASGKTARATAVAYMLRQGLLSERA